MQTTTVDKDNTRHQALLERALHAAGSMYPTAEIRVHRGRVIAIEGDVIRWITYENLDRDGCV